MNTLNTVLTLIVSSLYLAGCGGGAGETNTANNELLDNPAVLPVNALDLGNDPIQSTATNQDLIAESTEDDPTADESASDDHARYRVTLENLWGAEDFPQGFPAHAHFSLVGGATHNSAVSFWELGGIASPGIEDMAEAGLIDKLLFEEVAPAITNGTANAMIEIREFTDAQVDGIPGVLMFDIDVNIDWPQLSMVTMLGPSPDWFVGVSGLSLYDNNSWATELELDLPLYDAGTKSDITPIMGGPDIIPPNPIGLVAYDESTGVYLATDTPQNVARLSLKRIR